MMRLLRLWSPPPLLLLLLMLLSRPLLADVYNSASQLASVLSLERRLVGLAAELNRDQPHSALSRWVEAIGPAEWHFIEHDLYTAWVL